jgi:predicted nucleic acid-binding protein
MQVAIDTSVLVGILVPNDLWHERAVTLWQEIETHGHTAVYFDCVAAEMISVATRRYHEKKRHKELVPLFSRLKNHLPAHSITWILPNIQQHYDEVLNLMEDSGGGLNFNDALIAIACRERSIPAIASFDSDFDQINWLKRLSQVEDLA